MRQWPRDQRAGCVRYNFEAGREKLRSAATVRNTFNSHRSIGQTVTWHGPKTQRPFYGD